MPDLTWLLAQSQTEGFATYFDKVARAPLGLVVAIAGILTGVRLLLWPTLRFTDPDNRFGVYVAARIVSEVLDAAIYAGMVIFMLVRPFAFQTFYIPSGSMIDTLRINDYIVANKWAYRIGDPKVGDIVVFRPPPQALEPGQEDTDFIKRCVGGPGDLVEIKDKKFYRNGDVVAEPYVDYTYPLQANGPVLPKNLWPEVKQADFKLVAVDGKYVPLQYTRSIVNRMPLVSTNEDDLLTQCAAEYVPPSPQVAAQWLAQPPATIPPGHYLFMGDNRNGSSDGRSWGLVSRESVIGKCMFIWFPFYRFRATP